MYLVHAIEIYVLLELSMFHENKFCSIKRVWEKIELWNIVNG